jgi:SAM-dependent methyltransferase
MPDQSSADLASLSDLLTPWCVHVAATLRIAHALEAGAMDVHDLATQTHCDAGALHGVLSHLVSKGLFQEPEQGRFALNDAARQLLDPAALLGLDLDSIGGRMAHTWGTLLTYVRTGAPAYEERFGLPFWEDLAAHPHLAADFDALIGPAGHGVPTIDFDIVGGWESVRTVVDVGGGTGAMLAEILRTWPHIHGTLVDLAGTVARSSAIFAAAGVTDRVTISGQSFFDPLPAGADLYLLRGVLNDWPDQEATAILRRCAEAVGPRGRVVILKGVRANGAPPSLEIEMLLVGGRKRTVDEFRDLALRAALAVVAFREGPPGSTWVECRMV